MEKQYKLNDRVSKDALKSSTFKKWLKRILCAVFIISLALQLTLCCIPMQASALEYDSIAGTWVVFETLNLSDMPSFSATTPRDSNNYYQTHSFYNVGNGLVYIINDYDDNDNLIISVTNAFYVADGSESVSGSESFVGYKIESDGYNEISYLINSEANRTIEISSSMQFGIADSLVYSYLSLFAYKLGSEPQPPTQVYDFTGEYRLFNEQLTDLSFSQAGTVTQSYAFDFNIWGGYNADYFHVQADGSSVDISYAFTDEGSGGIKTVYRQLLRDGEIVGTWLVPRARLIYFQSNPEDPTFQQWLLDNTVLIDESMIESVYSFGYDNGYNDGWTNSAIGDTLKAPVEALNNIILLDIAGVTITLGGVIFTMVVLSIMLIFLKKYAGG